jgi:hypothetical protein
LAVKALVVGDVDVDVHDNDDNDDDDDVMVADIYTATLPRECRCLCVRRYYRTEEREDTALPIDIPGGTGRCTRTTHEDSRSWFVIAKVI